MKYKIIACDMDETLLSSDATICQRNIEAITAAIAKGVKFVPCTGRGFRSIEGVLRTLGLYDQADQYVIGLMGPILRKIRAADPFLESHSFDLADRIFRRCCAYGQCMHIYTRDVVYITNITPDEEAFLHGAWGTCPSKRRASISSAVKKKSASSS